MFVGKNVVPGEKAKGLVLHVDAITSKVYVSLREELLKKKSQASRCSVLNVSVPLSHPRGIMNFEWGEAFPPFELQEN